MSFYGYAELVTQCWHYTGLASHSVGITQGWHHTGLALHRVGIHRVGYTIINDKSFIIHSQHSKHGRIIECHYHRIHWSPERAGTCSRPCTNQPQPESCFQRGLGEHHLDSHVTFPRLSHKHTYAYIQVNTAQAQADGVLDIPVHPDNMIWLKLNPQQAASVYEQLGGRNKLGQLILQFHFVEGQDAGDASDFVINVNHNLFMS